MSPMKQVRVRRWLAVVVVAAVVGLPSAAWVVGSRVSDTSEQVDRNAARTVEVARLAVQVRELALRTSHDAQVTTVALCALRDDLQVRVDGSRRFLRAHPHGFLSVSAKEIRDAAANQQRTIAALSGIDCPK